jgi:hypothetical protein
VTAWTKRAHQDDMTGTSHRISTENEDALMIKKEMRL